MTTGRKILSLSDQLMDQIDAQRGEMDRGEFIGLLMDMAIDLEGVASEEAEDEVACVVPGGTRSSVSSPTMSAPIRNPRARARQLAAADAQQFEETLPLGWWIPAILLFGFGDTITSALVFASGGIELNPVMRFALNLPGGLWSFVIFKTVFLGGLMALGARANPTMKWLIPLFTTAVGSYLIWNNMFSFLGLN